MEKKIFRRLGTILLALAVTVTMVPLAAHTGQASAETYPSNPVVEADNTTWDCVYFGSYPQTEIVGEEYQCGTYGNGSWGKDTDYKVDGALYSQLQDADFDSNGDTTIDGIKYRRIKKGDSTYGTSGYLEMYNWSDSNTYHYFRYDKIKWRVLDVDGNNAFLLADKALDDQKFNEVYAGTTWGKCTLRSWLNGYDSSYNTYGKDYSSKNFIDTAFSSSEQSVIYSTSLENNTTDKIFLLSESDVWNTDEAVSYGFVKAYDTKTNQRQVKSSTYAKAMGTWSSTNADYAGNCNWWLRSPGSISDNRAVYIYYSGSVYRYGFYVHDDNNGVRPALHLNLESGIWSYAGTVLSATDVVTEPEEGTHDPQDPEVKEKGNHKENATKHFKINLKGTGISGLTKYKMAFKVKWKKQTAKTDGSRISGYQIRYSTSSDMKNAKTVTKSGYTSSDIKIKGLKAKKKYYVQIRTYQTVNGTKYYSSWSSKKSVTTK